MKRKFSGKLLKAPLLIFLGGIAAKKFDSEQKKSERQRQFTANALHKLRTPLAVIQAESTLVLSKERTADEYRKALELISREATYMSALIESLLFLARSDAGKEKPNLEEINLRDLVTEISSEMKALALEKGLQINLGSMEDLKIKGDRVKLKQLFLNLMQNSINNTPSGGSIASSVVRKKKMSVISISDTGIGLSPKHLPYIFDRFYRVDKAHSRAEGGAGLGLAIAKSIVEAHNGKIEVESHAGRGSTFVVSLPLS